MRSGARGDAGLSSARCWVGSGLLEAGAGPGGALQSEGLCDGLKLEEILTSPGRSRVVQGQGKTSAADRGRWTARLRIES